MINDTVIRDILRNKWLLIDTNVLFKASSRPDFFVPLFRKLSDLNCKPSCCEFIKQELLRNVTKPDLLKAHENYLKVLDIKDIPFVVNEDLTKAVCEVSRKLKTKKKPVPGLIDLYLISLIRKYSPNLFLLTNNHKDFSYELERFYSLSLDLGTHEIFTLGFYKSR